MNEADTCRTYVLPKLKSAGWEDEYISEQMVLTPGRIVPIGDRHTRKEGLRPDYTLFIRQNIPIAVVEAKAEYAHPAKGLQQAIQYAEMMGLKFAYSSNGKGIVEHDFITGMERDVDSFPSPDELWGRLKGTFKFEDEKDETDALSQYWQEVGGKSPRYYQQVAINKAVNAVVVPDGFLFGDGVSARIKEQLLRNFDLHTIVRLPNGVFAPYTGIQTNLLFFARTQPTTDIWYYEHTLPEGVKNYTKTRPMQFEEFAPLIEWWDARVENEHAWKVRVDDVLKYDENKNLLSVNLDIKNPNGKEDLEHLPPHELAESILVKERQIAELMDEIKSLLTKAI